MLVHGTAVVRNVSIYFITSAKEIVRWFLEDQTANMMYLSPHHFNENVCNLYEIKYIIYMPSSAEVFRWYRAELFGLVLNLFNCKVHRTATLWTLQILYSHREPQLVKIETWILWLSICDYRVIIKNMQSRHYEITTKLLTIVYILLWILCRLPLHSCLFVFLLHTCFVLSL